METRTKIILIIILVLLIFSAVITYYVIRDLNIESKLKKEIITYQENLLNNNNVNDNIINTGDYGVVERKTKDYLKEINDKYNNLLTTLKDEQINNILTINNYLNDGPNFVNTKAYFTDIKNRINNDLDNYEKMFTEDKIDKYIQGENIGNYYKTYFKRLINNEDVVTNLSSEVNDDSKKILELLNSMEKVIDYLIANNTSWQIVNNTLIFYNPDLENTYNDYVKETQNLL